MKVELKDFKDFFVGNQYNIGKQYKKNGKGEWMSGTISFVSFKRTINIDVLLTEHLKKQGTYGSYPFYQIPGDSTWYCKYIMVDIDDHHEIEVQKIVKKLDAKSKFILEDFIVIYKIPRNCILRDFSGRGYHVWIKLFYKTTLKRAWDFKIDIEKRLLDFHGIKEEVFPKQNESTLGKFGNCCKLPLSINQNNDQFCEILDGFDLSKQGPGYKIIDSIPNYKKQKKSYKSKEKHVQNEPIKIEINDECFEYYLENIKPCFKAVALGTIKTHNVENIYNVKNDRGHYMNIGLCNCLYYLGASREIRIKAFEKQDKFDYDKTKYYVEKLEKSFKTKFALMNCERIQERGLCLKLLRKEGECKDDN